ncbi:putative secreted protein [Rhodopirellula maiorica SM1]|uniref:Putative secreted protein n=1 Tax=Rhodopirellula maiorica SM1 TaxID=1265738 RepID=M5RU31_9BACT|nr:hypothetical protein [Rhodopirellula maiorica]EMI22711.1 putative secreted protein [Rhodopirellula maiorica SM1]
MSRFSTHLVRSTFFAFALFVSQHAEVMAVEIAPLRYSVDVVPNAFVPYAASHSFTEPNRNITRVLFSIHSSDVDAMQYYDNARDAASRVRGALPQTLIVAPQFLQQTEIPSEIPDGLLFWRSPPYRGSSRAAVGPKVDHVSYSAYAVIDAWLGELTSPDLFPRLKEIVLVGHSAGGQFVQRYALVGKFKPADSITIRFVVSAPSSYAYTSAERYHTVRRQFVMPDADTAANCKDYNNWGYGLGAPYGYFADADLDAIAKDYANKNVFYLCGSKDADPNDGAIGKSCGAMMQGMHRLQRMQLYAAFLQFKYGKSVTKRHRFAVVPNMGHYGRGTMTSPAGLQALFSPIR